MADFGYSKQKCYQKLKNSKPIANGNVADSGMIALIDEPLPYSKLKKE